MLFVEPIVFVILIAASGFALWRGIKTKTTWLTIVGGIGVGVCALILVSVLFLMMAFSSEVNR